VKVLKKSEVVRLQQVKIAIYLLISLQNAGGAGHF